MTDSTFIAFDPALQAVKERVVPVRLFRKKKDQESYDLRILNTLSNFATSVIKMTLDNYLGRVNVPKVDRPNVNMKNEFYYSRVMVTYAKKSYVGLQKRQEALIYKVPELDVKGVNFFKSTASENTSKFIYDKVLMGEILQPEDGKLSLMRAYKTIYDFQQKMLGEIQAGDMGYLKRSIKVKTPDGYSNPMRIGSYKAVYVWNKINDDKDRIDLPATVTIVKVSLATKKDAAKLENWPKIYERVCKLFDTDPEIGDFSDKDGKIHKGKGIKAIALPEDLDEVPDWVLAVIDAGTLLADNMALFSQLYRPLGLTPGGTNSGGSAKPYYTNIVRL